MNGLNVVTADALTRIRNFLDANQAQLGAVNASESRRIIDDVSTRLDAGGAEQGTRRTNASGETANIRRLESVLRKTLMAPVSDMAYGKKDQIAQLEAFRMPPGNIGGRRLAMAAISMADSAAPYASTFVTGGLRPDFIDQLRAAATGLLNALTARVDHTRGGKGATISLGSETKRARSAIRAMNGAVVQQLADQPDLVKQWKAIKRLPRTTSTAVAAAPAPATPAPPAAPTVPVAAAT